MIRLLIFPIFTALLFTTLNASMAVVLVNDATENSIFPLNSNTGTIETGMGSVDDYVLLFCANNIGVDNPFNAPSPQTWETLNTEPCGGPACTMGIWGAFVDEPVSVPITCSWEQTAEIFVAVSIRAVGVDRNDPLIGIQCNSGSGTIVTSPALATEAGSLGIVVFGTGIDGQNAITTQDFQIITNGAVPFVDISVTDGEFPAPFTSISAIAASIPDAGEIPSFELEANVPIDWKGCAIALRMESIEVPAISEIGLISLVVLTGIAGLWYLRRRQIKA